MERHYSPDRTLSELARDRGYGDGRTDLARFDVIVDELTRRLDAAGAPSRWGTEEVELATDLASLLGRAQETEARREAAAEIVNAIDNQGAHVAREVSSELEDIGKVIYGAADDIAGRIDSSIYHGESMLGRLRWRWNERRARRAADSCPMCAAGLCHEHEGRP